MKNILFVCTGNSCRSVMAEGLFRKLTEARAHEFSVASAGISAMDGFPATEETIRAMAEVGVDVSGHRSRRLTYDMIRTADEIYVMEEIHRELILRIAPEAEHKVFLLTDVAGARERSGYNEIPDPIRMSSSFYRNVLSVIKECVGKIVEKL
jgi:protein-tyrosine phosphatase